MIQRPKQRYSNMLLEHAEHNKVQKKLWSSTAPGYDSRRLDLCLACGHSQLRKRESEVESAHLFLTIIQFSAHFILLLNTQARAYTTQIISHSPTHFKSAVGCPPRYIAMLRQFHDGMQARNQNDGENSEPFPVTNKAVLWHQHCSA